jgi:DNA-binding NtrC family response regulator
MSDRSNAMEPGHTYEPPRNGKPVGTLLKSSERELIFRTLQQTRWNRREAAGILGISYKALLHKIKEAELGGVS